jgi:hypothetical protein
VFGVIDQTSVLIETIPTSSGSHSVAADSARNLIFVPEQYTSAPTAIPLGDQNLTAGPGSPTVGQLVCGTTNGCIAVYSRGPYTPPSITTPGTGAVTIVVKGPNPNLGASIPTFQTTSKQFGLDASQTTTPNPNPTFSWTYTPGYPIVGITGGSTATPVITVTSRGEYHVTVTVTDTGGTTASQDVKVVY